MLMWDVPAGITCAGSTAYHTATGIGRTAGDDVAAATVAAVEAAVPVLLPVRTLVVARPVALSGTGKSNRS